ncbi:MAG: hypothetical protein WD928_18495 [Gammaproteobacteria bacterium]
MHIEFAEGDNGFHEAHSLLQIVRDAQAQDPSSSAVIQLLDVLRESAQTHMERAEFAAQRAQTAAPVAPPTEQRGIRGCWRALFGPSRRELMLSEQRSAALQRAQRAETSAFEALAETARVARERDAAMARLAALEAASTQRGDEA